MLRHRPGPHLPNNASTLLISSSLRGKCVPKTVSEIFGALCNRRDFQTVRTKIRATSYVDAGPEANIQLMRSY